MKIAKGSKILSVTNELKSGKEFIINKGDFQFGRGWIGHIVQWTKALVKVSQ